MDKSWGSDAAHNLVDTTVLGLSARKQVRERVAHVEEGGLRLKYLQ